MADSLVLTGVRDIKKHTGTEMVLRHPPRGGNTWQLKQWWNYGSSAAYVTCTVFDVTTAAGTCKLALDTTKGTNVRIDHDGSFGFNFYGINEVSRAALFTDGFELIEHYAFPRLSGGKVMTVTPPNAASRPSGTSPSSSPTPTPTPTPTPSPTPTPTETGPFAIEGYYPLYDTEAGANAAGSGTNHPHTLSGTVYYMPNGVTIYHGTYGVESGESSSGGGGY